MGLVNIVISAYMEFLNIRAQSSRLHLLPGSQLPVPVSHHWEQYTGNPQNFQTHPFRHLLFISAVTLVCSAFCYSATSLFSSAKYFQLLRGSRVLIMATTLVLNLGRKKMELLSGVASRKKWKDISERTLKSKNGSALNFTEHTCEAPDDACLKVEKTAWGKEKGLVKNTPVRLCYWSGKPICCQDEIVPPEKCIARQPEGTEEQKGSCLKRRIVEDERLQQFSSKGR